MSGSDRGAILFVDLLEIGGTSAFSPFVPIASVRLSRAVYLLLKSCCSFEKKRSLVSVLVVFALTAGCVFVVSETLTALSSSLYSKSLSISRNPPQIENAN